MPKRVTLVVCLLSFPMLSCGDIVDPDVQGLAALEVEAFDSAGTVTSRVTGVAELRPLLTSDLIVAVRVIRPTRDALARGDLQLRLGLPSQNQFRGAPTLRDAWYTDSPLDKRWSTYAGDGAVEASLEQLLGRPQGVLGLELRFPRQGEPLFRVRGLIVTGATLDVRRASELAALPWSSSFDLAGVVARPDLDLAVFLASATGADRRWMGALDDGSLSSLFEQPPAPSPAPREPYEPRPIVGGGGGGGSGDGWGGGDGGASGCSGGDGSSDSSGCDSGGGDDGGCGGDGGGCDGSAMEGCGDVASGCGDAADCSTLRGAPRTLFVLITVLLAARWRHRRRRGGD